MRRKSLFKFGQIGCASAFFFGHVVLHSGDEELHHKEPHTHPETPHFSQTSMTTTYATDSTATTTTTVGQCGEYDQFRDTFTIDHDYASNVVDPGDVFSIAVNLVTASSEVADVTVNCLQLRYYRKLKNSGV